MKRLRQYYFLWALLISMLVFQVVKVNMAIFKEVTPTQASPVQKEQAKVEEPKEQPEQTTQTEQVEAEEPKEQTSQTTQIEQTKEEEKKKKKKKKKQKQFCSVELDYLNDALFIGDSRTSTLYEYAGWEETDFFVKTGLSIWEVWDKTMEGRKLQEVLAARQYKKVYIMLGVNELGNGTPETFREEYQSVLKQIQEMQPNAIIFLQAILHVSSSKDAEGTYINNAEINVRNQELKTLTDNKKIFWLDANEVMDDGEGTLNAEYTFDGVHLKVKYINIWQEFLLKHGII